MGLPRITGSGLVRDPSGGWRVATISARMMPDGTIKGEGQGVVLLDETVIVHFNVDCVRTFELDGEDGQGAVLSGWTTFEKNFPDYAPVPAYLVVAVFDAGEGNDAGVYFPEQSLPQILNTSTAMTHFPGRSTRSNMEMCRSIGKSV